MTTITALKYYKSLRDSKVPDAEALAQACAFDEALVDLATKDDLKTLEDRIDIKLSALEARINAKLDTVRTLGWALFVLFGIIASAMVRIALIMK